MIVNEKIAKYKKVIFSLTIIAIVLSLVLSILGLVNDIHYGEWNGSWLQGIGRYLAIFYICFLPLLSYGVAIGILNNIDCAKIFQCVDIQKIEDLDNAKIVLTDSWDRIKICLPIISDVTVSLLIGITVGIISNFGLMMLIFATCLLSFFILHFFSYLTIIFYVLSCRVKKKELSKILPSYLADKREELQEKRKSEKISNDKIAMLQLLEQCGMKFFLKYYKTLLRLPVRDIEIDENYTPEEKNERLSAAKSLIEQGFSKYAAQHILDNYADLLTDDEKTIASEILAE